MWDRIIQAETDQRRLQPATGRAVRRRRSSRTRLPFGSDASRAWRAR